MKTLKQYIVPYLLVCCFFVGCNTTEKLLEEELLLTKNIIKIDGHKNSDVEVSSYLIQRPNTRLLGMPIGLYLYNIGNTNYDSIYQEEYAKIASSKSGFSSVFSKKQQLRILDKKRTINNWFLRTGEAPEILNPNKTKLSAENLRTYFFNHGFFNTTVKTTAINNSKTSQITYNIQKGSPYYIADISYKTDSKAIDSILKTHKNNIALKKGKQYNLEDFTKTLKQITSTLRNNGFYHFSEGLVSFRNIDTIAKNNKTNIEINIQNRKIKQNGKTIEIPTEIQKIKQVSVFTDYNYSSRNQSYKVNKSYELINFYAHRKLDYRIKSLKNSIFIEPEQIFSDENVDLTRKHLKSLNNFKSIRINHKELPNNELSTSILLTPQKKYSIVLNNEIIHSNIKQLGLSGGFSFINRNTFKGAEIFKLSLQGSIFDTATDSDGENSISFNAYEVGVDASLEFPKFIFPFLGNLIPRTMTPKTKISIGTSFQENIGLDKQRISGVIDYNWNSSSKNTNTIEVLNLQFVNNLNIDSYYEVYSSEYEKISDIKTEYDLLPDLELTTSNANYFLQNIPDSFATSYPSDYTTLKNIEKREEIITSNNIIPITSYTFEHNSRKGLSDINYNFFRTKISSSGNLSATLFDKENNQPVFEDIEISQFLKLDIDFRKFWRTSIHNSLAFRSFLGVAIPTGVTKEIPFISSYFAGGSNDIRAWKTYELGPGSSNSGLEYNIGNIKFLTSLEYRFKVLNSINGAIFFDAGNIWNLPNTSAASEEEIFSGISSLENIALGSGLGFRYDFNFLVLRLDWAFKTYEPYLDQNKWFKNYNISESVLNIGINYPF